MRWLQCMRSGYPRLPGALMLAAALYCTGIGLADRFPTDPVDELQSALKSSPDDYLRRDPTLAKKIDALKPEARLKALSDIRDQEVTRRVDAIKTLGDMRRALLLDAWKAGLPGTDSTLGDIRSRTRLVDRFRAGLQKALDHGTEAEQLAVLNLISELGVNVRLTDERVGFAASFAPQLVTLIDRPVSTKVRRATARALGETYPDPNVAVGALAKMLKSADVEDRRVASWSLINMGRVVAQLTSQSETTTSLKVPRPDPVPTATAVIPPAAKGLSDPDVQVRRNSAEAIAQAGALLREAVPQPRYERVTIAEAELSVAASQKELAPLINVLRDQVPALSKGVMDSDEIVRVNSRRAFEELGTARQRFLRLLPAGETLKPDPILEGMLRAVDILAKSVVDPSVRSRLSGIDALETLGTAAAPAAPQLLKALGDPDRFVRWSATRTLGKMGPVPGTDLVAGLAKLLFDDDLDVALAATVAIDRFGPAARKAIPALVRALGATDAEMRIAVIRTLTSIGTDAKPATGAIGNALADVDARVRTSAALSLARFGPLAAGTEPALRQALNDPNSEVRRAASDALLAVSPPKD